MAKDYYGNTMKSIRIARRISQKSATDGKFNRSLIAKIEKNEVIPSIHKFQLILQQLNLSFDEFFFIHRNYGLTQYQELTNKFYSSLSNSDIDKLSNLVTEFSDYLNEHDSFYIKELKEVALAIIDIRKNNFENATRLVEPIWTRLSKVDLWTISDLKLINCILFIFPIEVAINIGRNAISQLEKYKQFLPDSQLKVAFKLNLTGLLLTNGKFSQTTLDLLEEILIESKENGMYDCYAVALFRKGALLQANYPEIENEEMDEAIQILELLKEQHLIDLLLEDKALFLNGETTIEKEYLTKKKPNE
ncbi:helix-turn-helix domain-containing protein [Isobaculum melis]|uniref:Transcriptional activator, Rgg/GadR/MutR family, C-terminal domain-containing protein n=1 Tax=Isobaculum melis TaxID=142588 RepID=A0A1H9PYR8_9LACT|nr:helix-turn-helix transcriptional regulator [Isobaculum melis]SER53357.1 transcriptional activator, Rgg/GadR/MutR family, C-terminal domain-containing protein [Isobaculum melis]